MKTNIRTAKTKLFNQSIVYYVPSKSGGDEHIVVSTPKGLFCDCKDFMTRRLPLIGTPGFSSCTHGKRVTEHTMSKTALTPEPKYGYGVYYVGRHGAHRSLDLPKIYSNKKDAERAVREFEKQHGKFGHIVRAV